MVHHVKVWLSKYRVITFVGVSLLVFILNQIIVDCQSLSKYFQFYDNYFSSSISVIASGIFIALLVYYFTVTLPEKRRDKYTLNYILEQYYQMKEDALSTILIIINEPGEGDVKKLSRDVIKAKSFLDAGNGKEKQYRRYKLWNELSPLNYKDINIHLQNFVQVLSFFANTKTALKHDMVPMLVGFIQRINFNNHYIENGQEMGGDQYKPFLDSLFFIFTGFDFVSGDTGQDYFETKLNNILSEL